VLSQVLVLHTKEKKKKSHLDSHKTEVIPVAQRPSIYRRAQRAIYRTRSFNRSVVMAEPEPEPSRHNAIMIAEGQNGTVDQSHFSGLGRCLAGY
jgi:hypothetical protein